LTSVNPTVLMAQENKTVQLELDTGRKDVFTGKVENKVPQN